jgi:hypothetical protein
MTTICDEHFNSQKQLHTRLRHLLKNKTDILIPKNQAFAIKIVQRYNKVYEVGEPVQKVLVDVNRKLNFPELCMHVVFKSGHKLTVSIKNVARAAMSTQHADAVALRRPIDTKFEQLRDSVLSEIQAFKIEAYQRYQIILCALCHKNLKAEKREQVHVDHFGINTEFRHLVENFRIDKNYQTILDIDPIAFAEYHFIHSKLQLLCAMCNVKKERPKLLLTEKNIGSRL